jgi:serine/threonine protein kinase, bacterial
MSLSLYPIIRQIGSGGFGKTFLAKNTLLPSQLECVVKQLVPMSNDPQLQVLIKERFEKEGLVLESLSKNSNGMIPCLYAYFTENNEFYLVQEYIEGQNLSEKIKNNGLFTEEQVRKLLNGILPILIYIHNKGIVHRDIKPENIMLCRKDDRPVLIDFGAVKETMSTVANIPGNTEGSIVIGTPGFMPMEQLAGRPTFSSDFYALGLTMIYLLTGHMPANIGTDPYTGKINWHSLAPQISSHLREFIDKAIQPVFSDRYKNAQEMLSSLNDKNTALSPMNQNAPAATTVVSPVPVEHRNLNERGNRSTSNPDLIGNPITGVIIGTVVGGALLASGAILWSNFSGSERTRVVDSSSNRDTDNTKPSEKPQIKPSTSPLIPSTSPSKIERVGWLRIGAVNSTDGRISVGQPLISTTQPVTISPSKVPSIGDRITIINSVNVRIGAPQPPDYRLPEQTSALPSGQELFIMKTDSFVDPKSPSPFTAVWAEVGTKLVN